MSHNRRQFVQSAVAACAGSVIANSSVVSARVNKGKVMHGIARLNLLTTELDRLHRFYEDSLELPVERQGDEAILVTAGTTEIRFEAVPYADAPSPFYHFAFNIPENKLLSAQRWQKKRTPLVKRDDDEVIHFPNWNAHSVFFNDPAGNILEYIARHDLPNAAEGEFSPRDILYASEIGLVVDEVPQCVAEVKTKLGLNVYRDNAEFFASMGDEHALLILVKRNRLWTPDKTRAAEPYPVDAAIRGLQAESVLNDDGNYRVTSAAH